MRAVIRKLDGDIWIEEIHSLSGDHLKVGATTLRVWRGWLLHGYRMPTSGQHEGSSNWLPRNPPLLLSMAVLEPFSREGPLE